MSLEDSVVDVATSFDSPPQSVETAQSPPADSPSAGERGAAKPGFLTGEPAVDFMLEQRMIDQILFEKLTSEMEHPRVRAALGLYATKNVGISECVCWLDDNPNESSLEIREETPEQRQARVDEEVRRLRVEAEKRRAKRIREEKEQAIVREKRRREGGKAMREAHERYAIDQARRERALRKQDAREAARARRIAKRKIKIDQLKRQLEGARKRGETSRIDPLERKIAQLEGTPLPKPSVPVPSVVTTTSTASADPPPASSTTGPKCRVRVRLFDGTLEQNIFDGEQKVRDLFEWVRSLVSRGFRLQIPRGPTLGGGDEQDRTLADVLGRGGSLTCVGE